MQEGGARKGHTIFVASVHSIVDGARKQWIRNGLGQKGNFDETNS